MSRSIQSIFKHAGAAAVFAAVWSAMPIAVHAQVRGAAINLDPPATRDNKDTPTGVSVPDSPGAVEKLDKALDKEVQKQWKTAAEFYQEALAKYPARVVPDKARGTFQFVGVASVVQDRISHWPVEGLTIYRNLYGHIAEDLLASAKRDDVGTLRTVFSDYFATDAGKTAGIRLIDNYIETGDFSAAAWVGDRLLRLHPSLGGDWGMILYRTAVASHWSDQDTRAKALLDQLKQKNPNETGSIGGKDVLLVDALTAAISAPPPAVTISASDADTWPQFNGIDGRGDLSPSKAKPGATLGSVAMAPPDWSPFLGVQRASYETGDKQSIDNFRTLGVMPVADGGSLFFQDGRCVYAVNADTGIPLPGWSTTYGGDRAGHYRLSVFGRPANEQLTLTVTPTAVLAVMGQPDHTTPSGNPQNAQAGFNGAFAGGFGMQQNGTSTVKLVCLDRDTGRELWSRSPADLPDSVPALRTADYVGTPLVIPASLAGRAATVGSRANIGAPDDSVLVIARGGKEQQFDDCYLVCLSRKTGQYQWSSYLGSGTRGIEFEGMSATDPSQMAFADGRVFVMTNLGSVASVDPSDGRIIWLSSYERDVAENGGFPWRGRGMRQFQGNMANAVVENKPWTRNPVFVINGHVFILPTDAKSLFIYNAGTGTEEKRIATADYDNADVLIGVRDHVHGNKKYQAVVLSSQTNLFVLDWEKYDHNDIDAAARCKEPVAGGDANDNNAVFGRGFLTADSIFVPTRDRLQRIDWQTGKIQKPYPVDGKFSGHQGPGNVLVTAENVVIAGATQLDIYTELETVRARYEQKMAAAPNDPKPRVQFAIVLDAGGHTDEALARVDEAINLVGGIHSMRSGEGRTMIFTTLLNFAQRTASITEKDAERKAARIAFADQLFDRAAAAADTAQEQVKYRLARATADHENHNYADEVKLCQEILSDDALRSVVVREDQTAGDSAEARIETAIDIDRSVYRSIEAMAKDAKDKALATNDPEQLLAVGLLYPNSHSAVDARQAAVDRFEASHEPARAIDALRLMYLSTTDPAMKSQRLQQVANDFLALHEIGPALDRLARAAKLSMPDNNVMTVRLDLPDGTSLQHVPFYQAVDTLRRMEADEAKAKLPEFKLGDAPGAKDGFLQQKQIIEGVAAVVHPLRDFNRNDQILTWSSVGLSIFAVGQTTPQVTIPDVKDIPQGAAWMRDRWIAWTGTDLFGLAGDGKLDWSLSLSRLPTLQVFAPGDAVVDEPIDQNDTNNINNIRQINGQVVVNGQFVVRRGQRLLVQQQAPEPAPQAPDPAGPEQVVFAQPAGNLLVASTSNGRVFCVNSGNGQIVWQTRAAEHGVDQLLANAHFTVVRLDDGGGSQLVVYDTRNGRVVGRRRFGADGTPNQLVNVALSEEATLAFTLFNRLQVKDLYEPWKNPPSEVAAHTNQDNAPYANLNQPDQLLVNGGRLVCVYDSGRFLRGFDLTEHSEPTNPLDTYSNSTAVWLQMIGTQVFVVRTSGMELVNLNHPPDHNNNPFPTNTLFARHLFIGKDYAILLDEKNDRGPAGSPMVDILAYSRAIVPGKDIESGVFSFMKTQQSVSGITDWLTADGGLYYLAKDGKLRFLRGGRS